MYYACLGKIRKKKKIKHKYDLLCLLGGKERIRKWNKIKNIIYRKKNQIQLAYLFNESFKNKSIEIQVANVMIAHVSFY